MGSHGTEDQQGEFPGAVSEYKSYYMTHWWWWDGGEGHSKIFRDSSTEQIMSFCPM